MSVDVFCPQCFHHYRVRDEWLGRQATCAKCKSAIRITDHDPADDIPPPAVVSRIQPATYNASHPAGITLRWTKFLRKEWPWGALLLTALIATCVALTVDAVYAMLGAALTGALMFLLVQSYREQARWLLGGDLTPGFVVQLEPLLVAYYADLTSDSYSFVPMIKVQADVGRGLALDVGERVVAASLFFANPERGGPHLDIRPLLIRAWCEDPSELDLALQRVPHRNWAALIRGLQLLPTPISPGLYSLELPAEIYQVSSS